MYGKNMYLSFLNEEIYEDAEFNIEPLDKVGITGVNGAGKTTLFKVILGNIKLDKGTLYTGNKVIGYLPQEVEFTHNENVYEYLLSARPIKKLEDEIAELYTKISDSTDQKYIDKTLKVIAKKQEVLETLDYYNYENIIEKNKQNNYNKIDERERKKKYEKKKYNYNISSNCSNSNISMYHSKQNSKRKQKI